MYELTSEIVHFTKTYFILPHIACNEPELTINLIIIVSN